MTNPPKGSFNLVPWVVAASAFFVLSMLVLVGTLLWVPTGTRGPTGDMWGGSLGWGIGGASTLLFLATLLMQRQELSLQREELGKAMEIAQEQKEIASDQERHAEEQVRLSRVDSCRRSLGQLLEVRLAIVNSYSRQTNDQHTLRDRYARLFRLSQLVIHLLQDDSLEMTERDQWREAFGPWIERELEGQVYQCMTPPFKMEFQLSHDLLLI